MHTRDLLEGIEALSPASCQKRKEFDEPWISKKEILLKEQKENQLDSRDL